MSRVHSRIVITEGRHKDKEALLLDVRTIGIVTVCIVRFDNGDTDYIGLYDWRRLENATDD